MRHVFCERRISLREDKSNAVTNVGALNLMMTELLPLKELAQGETVIKRCIPAARSKSFCSKRVKCPAQADVAVIVSTRLLELQECFDGKPEQTVDHCYMLYDNSDLTGEDLRGRRLSYRAALRVRRAPFEEKPENYLFLRDMALQSGIAMPSCNP